MFARAGRDLSKYGLRDSHLGWADRSTNVTHLGRRMTSANIAFHDHPNEKRFVDQNETITVDSMFDWMVSANLAAALVVLRL